MPRVETPIVSNVMDTALIFEGGGLRGSFTAGVVTTLLAGEVFCDWVGGISAGSTNLVNYVARDAPRARRCFVEIAEDPRLGNMGTWMRGKGVFSSEWLYEQTSEPGQALPLDYEAFMANPAKARVGGFRCHDGELIYWGREDLTPKRQLMLKVRASSTMPLLMPITNIDGIDYVDGALGPTGGIAIDAAKMDGFERFLVVLTRKRGYRKPSVKSPRTFKTLLRKYPAVGQALQDRPANYNRTLDELLELERAGKAYLLFPDEMPIGNSERNVSKLRSVFEAGAGQARRELPRIREFLGLA